MISGQEDILIIIAGCKTRDRKAQKALYKMHYSFSMSLCMRYANSPEEAQEVMNDGFMKVFQYIEKFDITRPFKPWLKRILLNASIDYFHRHQNKLEEVDLEAGAAETDDQSALNTITYEEMLELVRKLPPVYRTIFNLRAIEGYKHEEIAKMLKISVGTSKSNYARAKEKLKNYLNTYFEVDS